ncbi:unnamed protein product [Trichobilharzia regenti]|nr:unnamed protein product [Trichobilharzia regenti]
MDDENKNKVLNESLDAEYNDTNDPEEANSRLKVGELNVDTCQRYKCKGYSQLYLHKM